MRRYAAVAALIVTGLFVGITGAQAQSALLNLPDAKGIIPQIFFSGKPSAEVARRTSSPEERFNQIYG